MVGLLGVGLIEALWSYLEFQALHGLINEIRALVGRQFQVADGVVAFLVVYVYKACDLWKGCGNMLQQVLSFLFISRLVVMELYEEHPLSGVRIAEHKISEQSVLRSDVIKRHAYLNSITVNFVADIIVEVVHQPTLFYWIYFIKGSSDMKTYGAVGQPFTLRQLL